MGNLYIADTFNNRIRKVAAGTGTISTVAGNGIQGYGGDGGSSTSAELALPAGVALDSTGNLYIADTYNDRIQKVEVTVPPSLTFPTATAVGSTDSMDGPQTITVSNIGNAALTLPPPTTGMNPSVAVGFTLDNASTCPQLSTVSAAGTLASGANCTLAVDFAPTAVGTVSGSLVLTDDTLNAAAPSYATQSIALSGTATPALTATQAIASAVLMVNHAATPFTPVIGSGGTKTLTYSVSPALPAGLSFNHGRNFGHTHGSKRSSDLHRNGDGCE